MFVKKETTPSTIEAPSQQACRIFEQFAEFANLPGTNRQFSRWSLREVLEVKL